MSAQKSRLPLPKGKIPVPAAVPSRIPSLPLSNIPRIPARPASNLSKIPAAPGSKTSKIPARAPGVSSPAPARSKIPSSSSLAKKVPVTPAKTDFQRVVPEPSQNADNEVSDAKKENVAVGDRCIKGELVHQLECGHAISTTMPEGCASNCSEASEDATEEPFTCANCIFDTVRAAIVDKRYRLISSFDRLEQALGLRKLGWREERIAKMEPVWKREAYREQEELEKQGRPCKAIRDDALSEADVDAANTLDDIIEEYLNLRDDEAGIDAANTRELDDSSTDRRVSGQSRIEAVQ